jgi:Derlin-2/3
MRVCTSQIITPYNIYFNAWLILQKLELWRLFTNFFFFGSLGAPVGLLR